MHSVLYKDLINRNLSPAPPSVQPQSVALMQMNPLKQTVCNVAFLIVLLFSSGTGWSAVPSRAHSNQVHPEASLAFFRGTSCVSSRKFVHSASYLSHRGDAERQHHSFVLYCFRPLHFDLLQDSKILQSPGPAAFPASLLLQGKSNRLRHCLPLTCLNAVRHDDLLEGRKISGVGGFPSCSQGWKEHLAYNVSACSFLL